MRLLGQVMLTATADFGLSLPAHQRPSLIHKLQAGGPAHNLQATSCQENYFYFLFDIWDLIGYNYSWTSYRAAAAIAQVTWP